MLHTDSVKSIHTKSFKQTALSVARCLLTTCFCLKFSASRMMVDGALWNALSPTLAKRTNTVVLQQKTRRRTVLQSESSDAESSERSSSQAFAVPEDWIRMQVAVAGVQAPAELARSAKRMRLLVASALSIFIFTFQGSMESALSTFDCTSVDSELFLRSDPKVKCSLDDGMYSQMLTTSIIGLALYCLLLPAITIITLRSSWCREVYVHDSMAYDHMFGFLTSLYSKQCVLWELVACFRKVAFVVIPVLIDDTLVQSVSMFSYLIVDAFFTLKMQPMANAVFNQIETLTCITLIVSCFSSIFFTVEYKGNPVLSGAFRDLAGLMIVIVCVICVSLSSRLMFNEYASMRKPCTCHLVYTLRLTLCRAHADAQK
jgi:hypothetical protein